MSASDRQPSILDGVNLQTVTLRELGEIAEMHSLKLEDVLPV